MLTLGGNLVITQAGSTAYFQGSGNAKDAMVNDGSIVADWANGPLNMSGSKFSNYRSVAASNGETLNITSTVFGTYPTTSLSGSGTLSGTVKKAGTIIASGGDTRAFRYA